MTIASPALIDELLPQFDEVERHECGCPEPPAVPALLARDRALQRSDPHRAAARRGPGSYSLSSGAFAFAIGEANHELFDRRAVHWSPREGSGGSARRTTARRRQCTLGPLGQIDEHKVLRRVQIVVPGFVNHAQVALCSRHLVCEDLVDLADLQVVATSILDADRESLPRPSDSSQSRNLLMPTPLSLRHRLPP